MRFLSIDLETTGLEPETCQIIEVGVVLEDTKNILPIDQLPVYHAYVLPKDGNLSGNIFALNMNAGIIEKLKNWRELADQHNFVYVEDLAEDFLFWLREHGFVNKQKDDGTHYSDTLNIAGKNFSGFDQKFLDLIPGFNDMIRIRHRVLDPAPLYFDPLKDDTMPNLSECKRRAGIKGEVTHLAIDDAKDVIMLIRKHFGLKPNQ